MEKMLAQQAKEEEEAARRKEKQEKQREKQKEKQRARKEAKRAAKQKTEGAGSEEQPLEDLDAEIERVLAEARVTASEPPTPASVASNVAEESKSEPPTPH